MKIGKCVTLVGGTAHTTRDKDGKDTFIILDINHKIHGYFPEWYISFHNKGGALKVVYAQSMICYKL